MDQAKCSLFNYRSTNELVKWICTTSTMEDHNDLMIRLQQTNGRHETWICQGVLYLTEYPRIECHERPRR